MRGQPDIRPVTCYRLTDVQNTIAIPVFMRKYYCSSKAGEHRRGGLYCIVLLLYTVFLRKYCTALYCISVGLYLLYMQYTIWLKWSCNMFIMKPNLKGQCHEMLKLWQQVNIFQSIKNSSYDDYSIYIHNGLKAIVPGRTRGVLYTCR